MHARVERLVPVLAVDAVLLFHRELFAELPEAAAVALLLVVVISHSVVSQALEGFGEGILQGWEAELLQVVVL